MNESGRDVWGEAAISRPESLSYEFFSIWLRPPGNIGAYYLGWRYPIVLSAPAAKAKARLMAGGFSINASAPARKWSDTGVPVSFYVGPHKDAFGSDRRWLTGPAYLDGYLPFVTTSYQVPQGRFTQQAFVSADPALSDAAVVFVRFEFQGSAPAKLLAHFGARCELQRQTVVDNAGKVIALLDGAWRWNDTAYSYAHPYDNCAV